MRKTILVLMLLAFAVDAWAGLAVTCTKSGTATCVVSYNGALPDPNRPRAFALDVKVSGTTTISNVSVTNTDYYIYPGSIVIDANGNVTNWGTAVQDANYSAGIMTIEMGSLYATNDANHKSAPPASGTLFSFDVSGSTTVTISKNSARGGVVKENGGSDLSDPVCTCAITIVTECFDSGHADYSTWIGMGSPSCWCNKYQCNGDADGLEQGDSKTGYFHVSYADLGILTGSWKKTSGQAGYNICADFNRAQQGDSKTGYFRVSYADLGILTTYWKKTHSLMPDTCGGSLNP